MRALQIVAASLLLIAMYAVADGAHAQLAPSVINSQGSVVVRGGYTAVITSIAGDPLPPSGTYQVSVIFSANSNITSIDPETQSGTFSSVGSYTAHVTASTVPDFDAAGSFDVTGTFAAGQYTVGGTGNLHAPNAGAVSFSGSGSYHLGTALVTARGTYTGEIQTTAFKATQLGGDYDGTGTVTLSPQQPISLQLPLPTGLLGGIGATAASGPAAAVAIAARVPAAATPTPAPPSTTTPAPQPAGTFASAPAFGAAGQALAVFEGGSLDQLEAAAAVAGASGVWAQDAAGRYQLLIVRGPIFANAAFRSAFPQGFTSATGVTLTR